MLNKTLMMKLIAVILVLMLSLSNFLVLVSYAAEISNSNSGDLSLQTSETNNKNIEFDSYFKQNGDKTYSAKLNIVDANKIYIKLKLSSSGYLKTSSINFEEESFNIKRQEETASTIQNIDYEKNEMTLNQINGNTEVELEIPIEIEKNEIFNIQNLNKNNKVLFKGTYVTEKGKEIEVEKEILLNIKWDASVEGILETNLSKYINNLDGETLLELRLNSYLDQNIMPLKETILEIEVPEIEEKIPKYVNVVANSLLSITSESSGIGFGEDNFEYIEDEKKIKINVQNLANENGEVWWKDGIDEYKIILVYDELTSDEKKIVINAKASFDVYGKTDKVEKTVNSEIILNENIGDINEIKLYSDNTDIYKSFMYANSEYETEYKLNWNLNVGYAEVSDKIVISDVNENFVDNNQIKTNANKNTYYKQTIISKKNFEKILGGEGYIKILNEANEEIVNITLNMTEDENIVINYQNSDLNKIKIETSKPQTEGRLEIEHVKAIKAQTYYERDLVKTFDLLENEINLNTVHNKIIKSDLIENNDEINNEQNLNEVQEAINEIEEIDIANTNAINNINLIEPETKVEIKTNKDALVTGNVNEDIEIYLNLINNKQEYGLFNNPVFDIRLPEEIDYIQIKDVKLVFEEELSVQNTELFEDENGIKHIRISLSGFQTKYNIGNIISGASLIILADMNLKDIDESRQAEIVAICTNENIVANAKVSMNLVKIEIPQENSEEEELKQEQEEKNNEDEIVDVEQEENNDSQTEDTKQEIEEEPKLEIRIKSNVDETTWVKSGEIVKYTIEIKNNSDKDLYNIVLKSDIPKNAVYTSIPTEDVFGPVGYEDNYSVENIKWNIETIEAGKIVINEYEVRLNFEENIELEYEVGEEELENNIEVPEEVEVICNAKAIYNGKEIESNTVKNILTKGYVELYLNSNAVKENFVKNDNVTYIASIKNIAKEDLENVNMIFNIPKGVICEEAYISQYNSETLEFEKNTEEFTISDEKIELHVSNLTNGESKNVEMVLKISNPEEITDGKLKDRIEVIVNDIVHYSNYLEFKVDLPKIEVMQISSMPEGDVRSNTILKYITQVKNTGNCTVRNIKITDYLPDNVQYITTEKYFGEEKQDYRNYIDGKTETIGEIAPGETMTSVVSVKVLGANSESLENSIKIQADGIEEIESNKVNHTINNNFTYQDLNSGSISNNTDTKLYSIKGVAWVDSNKNGIRELEEIKLSGVQVILLNEENNIQNTIYTSGNGEYSFEGLKAGKYRVIFIYDDTTYSITKYKATADDSLNSDVVETKIELEGKEKTAALTDEIEISQTDIYNIDIGLIENPKFDLKLEKYISGVSVKTTNKEKKYTYDNKKLAKIEFAARDIDNSNISIEYIIRIVNEGQVEGYATKIVDYLPKELTFNKELNPSWYEGEDGNLYTNILESQKILPGESKEIKLILTKQMSGEDTGLVNNNAEIYSAYNNHNLKDIDSIYANKKQGEDDIDYANVYLGIKTGKTILYISLIISQIIILGIGIYLIKRKVLNQ